jgi:mono/diheme cytochrome c family protein
MSNRLALAVAAGILLPAASGCAPSPTSGKGFTLPEGNVEQGQAAFVSLQCHACHSVTGVDLPEISPELDSIVQLGGRVPRISTYGELVTSIINPSHKLARGYAEEAIAEDGKSRMKNYNAVLTVQQLTDIVAFLQSRYELEPIEPTYYPPL